MLEQIIQAKTQAWLESDDCSVKDLISYIREKAKLRDTQIEAIETYLFLKITGQNKPLWQLFSEGFFSAELDLATLNINEASRTFLARRQDARALYDFASHKVGGKSRLPELEKRITEEPALLDYPSIIKSIFYGVAYADYLLSLPMGAGKTYLMAAFIYLDLYFARAEPENKVFAHNFLLLVPSGLKSSIVPSLRTIEHFDPSWVLAEPAASTLKQLLKFDVLDEAKSAKKSNKARNPNAQKVGACLPDPFGQVFVVNAEKVILDRLELTASQRLIEPTDDERDRYANELRNLIGKIPNLSLMIDEVHHAAKDDIKLRQVVNGWHARGNITTVLGFSGTPYLPTAEKLTAGDLTFKVSQITNTVYYYPLTTAIERFLKNPTVKVGRNLGRSEIIRRGVKEFQETYGAKVYPEGEIPKLAIYCSNIEVLEEEIYPFLTGELKINPDEILKYHKGNTTYKLPKENELEFRSLDQPLSNKRYILLVQIGKEGWDCHSLTSVILSGTGDSPKNMVLQTSCRCLRQVDADDPNETALIWLNDGNAKMLNEQLQKEQNTTLEALNTLTKSSVDEVPRHSRMAHLKLPHVDFYQLEVSYRSIREAEDADTRAKLQAIKPATFKTSALIQTGALSNLTGSDLSEGEIEIIEQTGTEAADYHRWLFALSKESFGLISPPDLRAFDAELRVIFTAITHPNAFYRTFNELYDVEAINAQIRLAFSVRRRLETTAEVVPQHASLLIADKLGPVKPHDKLFPSAEESARILELDAEGAPPETDPNTVQAAYQTLKDTMTAQGMGQMVMSLETFRAQFGHAQKGNLKHRDRSFHYLPYDFKQSRLEQDILQKALCLTDLKEKNLEMYFNGERGLTEFVIYCYACESGFWKNIGRYTTDFLILQRRDDTVHKALILETKGAGYSNDPVFLKKKHYVETEFLRQNNEKFGYARFDFLYLEDSASEEKNLSTLSRKITEFFND